MQNKLIVLLLLSGSAKAEAGLPSLGAPVAGGEAHASMEMKPSLKKMIMPMSIESLPIAPVAMPMRMTTSMMRPMTRELVKKEDAKMEIMTMGGAASKLLPESVKEDQKDEKSSTPLLSDNDQRCYAARFSDLKGAAPLTHYATVGVSQGRLGTCAKELTNYEAQTYLETFPELSQKFGRDTKASWDQARKHFEEIGYLNIHFSASMKADSK